MMNIAQRKSNAPKWFRIYDRLAESSPNKPPAIILGFATEARCRCSIPEKEVSKTSVVITLRTVDGRGFSINERVPITTKMTTSQKDENPSTENNPPAR